MNLSKIALGVALAALTTACDKTGQQANTTSATPATTAAANDSAAVVSEEIVYVNSDSLLSNYEYFKVTRTRLESKTKKAEANLRSKAEAFQRDVAKYQQTAQNMTNEQRASTEQRLVQQEQQLKNLDQSAGVDLSNESNEEMKKIYDKVEAYLQKLSAERGYKMVLTYSRGNSAILYSDNSLDITQEVVAGLNDQYKQEQEQAKATPAAATKK